MFVELTRRHVTTHFFGLKVSCFGFVSSTVVRNFLRDLSRLHIFARTTLLSCDDRCRFHDSLWKTNWWNDLVSVGISSVGQQTHVRFQERWKDGTGSNTDKRVLFCQISNLKIKPKIIMRVLLLLCLQKFGRTFEIKLPSSPSY